jgi:hypothetical protein
MKEGQKKLMAGWIDLGDGYEAGKFEREVNLQAYYRKSVTAEIGTGLDMETKSR